MEALSLLYTSEVRVVLVIVVVVSVVVVVVVEVTVIIGVVVLVVVETGGRLGGISSSLVSLQITPSRW